MQKRLSIQINNPCSEKWESFIKNEQGGFCSSCQKTVVDFTQFNDKEVIDYFKSPQARLCGRFRPDQLKTYTSASNSRPGYTKAFSVALGLLSFLPLSKAIAQTQKEVAVKQVQNNNEQQREQVSTPINEFLISGKVIDSSDGQAILGASVQIKETSIGTVTDANGDFHLKYQSSEDKSLIITVSFVGYNTQERTILLSGANIDQTNISLALEASVLGETVVISSESKAKRIWWRFKGLFTKNY